MYNTVTVGKREFIPHTSKYLKIAEKEQENLVITHQGKPVLHLEPVKPKTIYDLKSIVPYVKVKGDINEPVFTEIDKW